MCAYEGPCFTLQPGGSYAILSYTHDNPLGLGTWLSYLVDHALVDSNDLDCV